MIRAGLALLCWMLFEHWYARHQRKRFPLSRDTWNKWKKRK